MPRDIPTLETFLNRIEVGTAPVRPELTPCWHWAGARGFGGYGILGPRTWGEKYAHRWSFKHYHGALPEGHEVRHKCDERQCVNPDHLESGTHADNINDMLVRNQFAFRRVADNNTAMEIRARRAAGSSYKQLRDEYKISLRTVGRIVRAESKYVNMLVNAVSPQTEAAHGPLLGSEHGNGGTHVISAYAV